MTSEQVLARAVLDRGDEMAFRQLYRRHTPQLFQFALRMMGGAEPDAEDAVQETWVRAIEHLDGFRWEARLSTWLTGICLNICRSALRRKGRAEVSLDASPPGSTAGPAGAEFMDLERAIADLPERYRTVLLLHDVEGFTHREIAEQLGIAAGTSKSQLSHARQTIRRLLSPNGSAGNQRARTAHDSE